MTKNQIIIVTRMDDPHADDMILMLQHLGHEPVRLNTDDIPLNINMALGIGHSADSWRGSIEILTNGRVIDVGAILSIWWRRPSGFGLPNDLSEQEREFASDEIEQVLQGLWASLDCYWISHPEYIRRASWKGEQLKRAIRLGFEVPRTLITTDPNEARTFYDLCHRKMIFKVISDPFLAGL